MEKPKLQITDTHRAAAFKSDKRTHNGFWGCRNTDKHGPTSASRHKQPTHSPAGQRCPFLIPPAQRREGRKFSAGTGPAPPEPPGLALTPAPLPGAMGRGERLGHPGGPFGRPRQRGLWQTRTKEKKEAAIPRRPHRGRTSLSPQRHRCCGAGGCEPQSKAPLPRRGSVLPRPAHRDAPLAGGAVGRAQRAAPRSSRGKAQVAPAPRGEAPREGGRQRCKELLSAAQGRRRAGAHLPAGSGEREEGRRRLPPAGRGRAAVMAGRRAAHLAAGACRRRRRRGRPRREGRN